MRSADRCNERCKQSVYAQMSRRVKCQLRHAIRSLEERGLLVTEPTMVTTKNGCKRNGNLLFTIRPIQAALQQDYDRQMQKLTEDAVRRRYADFIENTS